MPGRKPTWSRALLRGLLAGVAGTAVMTAHQEIRQRLAQDEAERDEGGGAPAGEETDPWRTAPAPAQAGKRVIEGLFGVRVPPQAIPALAQVMHWSYGTAWGAAYAIARRSLHARVRLLGPLFGLGVWGASYVQLVPLGIYEPPWTYPVGALAEEIAFHITYGTGVAVAYELASRR